MLESSFHSILTAAATASIRITYAGDGMAAAQSCLLYAQRSYTAVTAQVSMLTAILQEHGAVALVYPYRTAASMHWVSLAHRGCYAVYASLRIAESFDGHGR